MAEQLEAGLVGPVEILNNEEESIIARGRRQKADHSREELQPLGVWIRVLGDRHFG